MFRRRHLFVSLFAASTIAAVTAGCAEDEKAIPRVVFDSSVAPGTHGRDCPEAGGIWFKIGAFGNPALGREDPNNPESPLKDPPKPVESGDSDPDTSNTVSITCNVIPSGAEFDVSATVELAGSKGGFFQVIGKFKPESGDQPNINVVLSRGGISYKQANCTARYVLPSQTVAAGRVWAEVTCEDMESGTGTQKICKGTATFRLENCAQ